MESWLSWECSHGDRHTSCFSSGMRDASYSELLTLTHFSLIIFSWGCIWGSDLLTQQSGVTRCSFWSLMAKTYVVAAPQWPSTCSKSSRHETLNVLPSFPVLFMCHGTKYSSMNAANDLWELVSSVNQYMGDMDDLFCYCAFRAWNTASVLNRENKSMKVWPLTRSENFSFTWSSLKACVGSWGRRWSRENKKVNRNCACTVCVIQRKRGKFSTCVCYLLTYLVVSWYSDLATD